MMDKRYISYKQAIHLLPDSETIHTFLNPNGGLLVGADWSREEILDKLQNSDVIEIAGERSKAMGHGMAAYDHESRGYVLFIETDAERLAAFEEFMDKCALKPCPFCGGKARTEKKSKTIIKGETAMNTYVRCTKCDARGERFLYRDFDTVEEARHRAREAWNRRVGNGKS